MPYARTLSWHGDNMSDRMRLPLGSRLLFEMSAGLMLCTSAFAQTKQVVAPPGSLIPGIPFSPAVRAGDLLYVAGTMATDASGKVALSSIEMQTRKTLENIGAILKAGGMDYQDVLS